MSEGGETCSARCADQPFDVGFHPTSGAGIFVAGLITGAVRACSAALRLHASHSPHGI